MIHLAGCIIFDQEHRIILLHRNKKGITQWELPGGKVEKDEQPEDAAIREIQEELGAAIALTKKIGSTSFRENNADYTYTWFTGNITGGVIMICEPETFDDLKSFSYSQLSTLKLSSNMQKLYQTSLKALMQ